MKEGIFIGTQCTHCTQCTQLFEDQDFSTKLNSTERRAWKAFDNVCKYFLGNESAGNYSEIVQKLFYHTLLWG
jgi:hypothetical protein